MKPALLTTAVLTISLAAPPLMAQQSDSAQGQPQQNQQNQIAQQCMDDLRTLGQEMNQDGYWLAGYRDAWGWRGYGIGPGVGTEPVDPNAPTAAPPAQQGEAAAPGEPVGPWGQRQWQMAPGYQVRVLYSAANILALRGDEQGCQQVLGETRDLYDGYVQQLRDAGVEPNEVTGWRQEQIAASQPVSESAPIVNIDNVTGTEVRNIEDEYLGSVEDVIVDPDGGIAYAVVAYGGFLGVGEDYVAIPWDQLRVTPGYNTFVLDVPSDAVENAPTIDPDTLDNRSAFQQRRQEIDSYWEQQQREG